MFKFLSVQLQSIIPLWICMLLSSISLAQESITITGKIIDAGTKEALFGATVAINGTTQGASTDANGLFVISGVTQREVTLVITYVGYSPLSQHYLIDQLKRPLSIELVPASVNLEEVVVEGQAGETIRAMIAQHQSDNIRNIVSAEQIATFPDMNAAEVMQRIPGITLQRDQGDGRYVQLRGTPPELTTFNVNGEQIPSPEASYRYVGMDIISSDQIGAVEVTKVLTPDMDADGIAGSVNIKTKDAEGKDPDIRATIAAGYGQLRESPNTQLQFSYSQRFGKFGFNLNSSYYLNVQGSDNIEFKYAKGPFFGSQQDSIDNYYVQYREVQLRHYEIIRRRIGISPSFDYRFNKHSFIYLRGMYNHFTDDETRRRILYDLDDALSETYYLYGGVIHDVRQRTKTQDLNTLALGGEHRLGALQIDYQLFYADAREAEPDRLEAEFESPGQAITINFDRTDKEFPRATFPNPANAVNVTNYDEYELNELTFEQSRTIDQNLTARLNIGIPYSTQSFGDGAIKFGGKVRAKDKERDIHSQIFGAYNETSLLYPGIGPKLSLTTISDDFTETNLLDQSYTIAYTPGADAIRDFYEFYPQHFIFDRTDTRTASFGEDYQADERIYAAYGMLRHEIGKLMILGGVRYESTVIDYEGRYVVTDGNRFIRIDTLTDQRTHNFVLPQIQLRYALSPAINIRGALTYSYARPNFEDVLPYRQEDRDEVKYGNPELIYPQSTNLDFLIERFYRKSIFSAGVFYKQIDDFIFFYKRFAHEGDPKDYGLVEITKAVNGKSASVYGAEFQAQFKFDFLPGFARNFGLYTNYTFTYSEAVINKRLSANYTNAIVVFGEDDLDLYTSKDERETITLPGQAKHTTNVALFYDSKRFFARLTANYQDDFLYKLGADPDLDEYYAAALHLDFTANVNLSENLKVFTDVINLTDAPLKYYLGTPDRIQKLEYYSWWYRFGIKLDF